ncbi:HET-domain-containing protein, partial [Sporormia fimetaria CBS 119925]
MSIYASLPLVNDNSSIRLLTVEPSGRFDAPLICQLGVAQLQPGLAFEALSYTWGDATSRTRLTVNQNVLECTNELAKALRWLRTRTSRRTMWIDQLCINQNDGQEKEFQIPLMSKIYSSCSRTVIWIGEADSQSGYILGSLREEKYVDYADLSYLLSRSWFRRIWIVQEIALAPEALI